MFLIPKVTFYSSAACLGLLAISIAVFAIRSDQRLHTLPSDQDRFVADCLGANSLVTASDTTLWATYQTADVVGIPALNFKYPKGFGIPQSKVADGTEEILFYDSMGAIGSPLPFCSALVVVPIRLKPDQSLDSLVAEQALPIEKFKVTNQFVINDYRVVSQAAAPNASTIDYYVQMNGDQVLDFVFSRSGPDGNLNQMSEYAALSKQIMYTVQFTP